MRHTIEIIFMRSPGKINGKDPLETVARRAHKQQLRIEQRIGKQPFFHFRHIGQMIQIHAQQPRMLHQRMIGTQTKNTRKRTIVEVGRFVLACFPLIGERTQMPGPRFVLFSRYQPVNFPERQLPPRFRVRNGRLEKRDPTFSLFHSCEF